MTFQDQPSLRVRVGRIAGAHGVKGLIKVLPLTSDLDLLKRVYTSEDGSGVLELNIKNPIGKFILAEVHGVSDRNAAEALGKCSLFVLRETIHSFPDSHNLTLPGIAVMNNSGVRIGSVLSVENYGAGDLLDIRLDTGKTVMVPLTADFVPEIADDYVIAINYEAFL